MMGPSIHLKQVSVAVKGITLLRPVTLSLEAGQWHGIAGPNGGGKSTLIKAIAGQQNHQGEIALHWPESRGNLGYMPQLAPFDASLPVTALDFLRMNSNKQPLWKRYKADPRIETVVEQIEIQSLLHKRMGALSSGERQRVLLACALMNNPKLLLLDEPLAGVDKYGRQHILAVLQAFKDAGGTLLMIEHDWSILTSHCETLSWIDTDLQGHGTPKDILKQRQEIHQGIQDVA